VRITVTSGDRQVHIHVKGKSKAKLRAAEQTARRLLTDTPDTAGPRPFGFTADSDTERADDDGT
jgi:hypothetical protein